MGSPGWHRKTCRLAGLFKSAKTKRKLCEMHALQL